jgi:hypothetical protein
MVCLHQADVGEYLRDEQGIIWINNWQRWVSLWSHLENFNNDGKFITSLNSSVDRYSHTVWLCSLTLDVNFDINSLMNVLILPFSNPWS